MQELRKGSYEEIVERVSDAIESATGVPVTVVATKPRLAHAVVEGRGLIEFTLSESNDKAVEVGPVEGFIDESRLPRFISHAIGEAVDELLNGDSEAARNRLRDLAMLARPGGRYLFTEEALGIWNSLKSKTYWRMAYNANRGPMRKAVYGFVRQEEAMVPRARYELYGDDSLVENRTDIEQSIAQIVSVLKGVAGDLRAIDRSCVKVEGLDIDKMLESVIGECTLLADHGQKASELARDSHLATLAQVHDSLAEVAKDAVIVRRFLCNSAKMESV